MLEIKKHISLKEYSSFKIGGKAHYFTEVKTKKELENALLWANEKGLKFFILGGGTNILVNDNGFDGLVIKMANNNIKVLGRRIIAGAGVSFGVLGHTALVNSLSGLEWGAGIPGTVGGAVRGNAGAFGSSIQDVLETVEVYDLINKKFKILSNKDCSFSYRNSIFKQNKNLLVFEATFIFLPGKDADIKKKINDYISKRTKSQPKLPSAGSVFMNFAFEDLKKQNKNLAELAQKEGVVKGGMVASGWIIDKLGLRGKIIGKAKVSLEHANFIVNRGGASAEEVMMLISYIKQQVRDKYGVQLKEEIQYL